MYAIITQTRQADGTIHASRTEVLGRDLIEFLETQRAEAGDDLISQDAYPA